MIDVHSACDSVSVPSSTGLRSGPVTPSKAWGKVVVPRPVAEVLASKGPEGEALYRAIFASMFPKGVDRRSRSSLILGAFLRHRPLWTQEWSLASLPAGDQKNLGDLHRHDLRWAHPQGVSDARYALRLELMKHPMCCLEPNPSIHSTTAATDLYNEIMAAFDTWAAVLAPVAVRVETTKAAQAALAAARATKREARGLNYDHTPIRPAATVQTTVSR